MKNFRIAIFDDDMYWLKQYYVGAESAYSDKESFIRGIKDEFGVERYDDIDSVEEVYVRWTVATDSDSPYPHYETCDISSRGSFPCWQLEV